MNNSFSYVVMSLFIACLLIKLIRQIKEAIHVRKIIKPDDYERKIILKSNYIHIVLYSAFILSFIVSILVGLNIVNIGFLTLDLTVNIASFSVIALLIGEFIVIPRMISNIRF